MFWNIFLFQMFITILGKCRGKQSMTKWTHTYISSTAAGDLDHHILIVIIGNIVITKILIKATGYLKSQSNIGLGWTPSMLPTVCLITYLATFIFLLQR